MTTETKKRGRPPNMSPEEYKFYRGLYHEIRTRRGLLNKWREINAFSVVDTMAKKEGVEGLEYLRGPAAGTINAGVLRELGYFEDGVIRVLAVEICKGQKQAKRTVREWGDILRTYRLHPEVFSETVSDNQEGK